MVEEFFSSRRREVVWCVSASGRVGVDVKVRIEWPSGVWVDDWVIFWAIFLWGGSLMVGKFCS